MRLHALAALIGLATSGCSLVFQDSVRSSSVYCSTSRFWYLSDFVMAGGLVYAATRANPPPAAYGGPALFAGSGLIGIYKRHHCERFRATAPPEVWAAAAEAERVRAEQRRIQAEQWAQAQAEAEAQAAAAQQQWAAQQAAQAAQGAVDPQPQGAAPPPQPEPQRRWEPGPTTSVQVERKVVPRSNMSARSHPECDQWLKMPPADPKDPFGNAQKLMQINRETCYRCTDSGKTLWIYQLPPAFQTSCE